VYFSHGGGMVAGDRFCGIDAFAGLVLAHDLAVVSVEYRLAPEHPFPAGLEDCRVGLEWVAEHAAELKVDPGRVVIAGSSAGGLLSAGLALDLRDRGGPAAAGLLLMGPMLDDRGATLSTRQHGDDPIWNRASNAAAWRFVLRETPVSAVAAPARTSHLGGLPPVFAEVGSAEMFRDEVVDFTSRIWAAGGSAELHVWAGGFHAYDVALPQAAISVATRAARTSWLRRTLALSA
jgi:acetyl esterase/lipase